MMQIRMPCVGTRKAAQSIRDDVLLAWLVADVELELLEKLGYSHKSQVKSHC